MTGMPPHTLASYPNRTPPLLALASFSFASPSMEINSSMFSAMRALLAVTTLLPLRMLAYTASFANVTPPATSTTMSISGSFTIDDTSVTIFVMAGSTWKFLGLDASRTHILVMIGVGAFDDDDDDDDDAPSLGGVPLTPPRRFMMISYTPPPTVPAPIMPMLYRGSGAGAGERKGKVILINDVRYYMIFDRFTKRGEIRVTPRRGLLHSQRKPAPPWHDARTSVITASRTRSPPPPED